jgi:fumarylacetoacetate (FAA) hydrolase
MKYGDTVKIDMFDEAGKSIFGAIEQSVAPLEPAH